MPKSSPETEPLRLDTQNECLWRGARSIALTPKAFAVLRYLADRPKRLVTKDELLDTLWAGTVVTDGVLKVCVLEIRKALEDDSKDPRFIQTVHRRGYRFLVDLERTVEMSAVSSASATRGAELAPESASVFVGRDEQLQKLERALATARGARRQLVFVAGSAGIGKTRLVEAFVERASRTEKLWVARGQCLEQFGASEAYLPVLDALGRLVKGANETDGRSLRSWLERRAPTWLAELGMLAADVDRERLKREILGATRDRMLREMAEALESLSLERPVVLVLEDLHWSDGSTLDLLAMLARRRENARVLVVATCRHVDALASGHPLKSVKHELALHGLCTEMELGVLDDTAVTRYLDARFAGHRFPVELASAIHARTEGNPLFLMHVVDALVANGKIRGGSGAWSLDGAVDAVASETPDTLRTIVASAFDRLPAEDQRVLEAASVAGLDFSSIAVAAALQQDVAAVEERCDALVRGRHFVRAAGVSDFNDGSACARYAFSHGLYASVLYRRLAPAQRMRLHQKIGERGEELYGDRSHEIASELAVHFEEGRDARRAVRYMLLAARTDARRYANREAASRLQRALELAVRLPAAERSAARLELLEEIGLVRRSMGDMAGSARAFEELVACAAEAGRLDTEVRALLYACSALFWIDRERCLSFVDRALELSSELDDDLLRAHTRGYCGHWSLNLRGFAREAFDACAAAVRTVREAQSPKFASLHVVRFAYAQILQGEYVAACRTADLGAELALEAGDAFDWLLSRFFRGWALLHAGEFGEMQTTLAAALALAERNGHQLWSTLYRLELAQMRSQMLDFEAARAIASPAVDLVREASDATGQILYHGLIALAEAETGLGASKEAARSFASIESALARNDGFMDWMLYWPLHQVQCEHALARGDLDAADEAAAKLRAQASKSSEPTYLALAHRASARIALARRNEKVARVEIGAAIDVIESRFAPLAAWRVQATAAEAFAGKKNAIVHEKRAREAIAELARSISNDADRERFVAAASRAVESRP